MAERKIDGKTYKVEPLLASEAIELYGQIIAVAGKAAGRLPAIIVALSSGDGANKAMADVAAIAAITDILNGSSPAGVRDLIKRIVEIAMVQAPSKEWRQVDLDGDFTGNLDAILPVGRFVVEEQFGDFFIGSAGNGILALLKGTLQQTK